jgi:hypothetical protein
MSKDLKQKFEEIEQQVELMNDLVNKQTRDFEDGLKLIYKFSLMYKIFNDIDENSEETKGLLALINQIKGAMLLDE